MCLSNFKTEFLKIQQLALFAFQKLSRPHMLYLTLTYELVFRLQHNGGGGDGGFVLPNNSLSYSEFNIVCGVHIYTDILLADCPDLRGTPHILHHRGLQVSLRFRCYAKRRYALTHTYITLICKLNFTEQVPRFTKFLTPNLSYCQREFQLTPLKKNFCSIDYFYFSFIIFNLRQADLGIVYPVLIVKVRWLKASARIKFS